MPASMPYWAYSMSRRVRPCPFNTVALHGSRYPSCWSVCWQAAAPCPRCRPRHPARRWPSCPPRSASRQRRRPRARLCLRPQRPSRAPRPGRRSLPTISWRAGPTPTTSWATAGSTTPASCSPAWPPCSSARALHPTAIRAYWPTSNAGWTAMWGHRVSLRGPERQPGPGATGQPAALSVRGHRRGALPHGVRGSPSIKNPQFPDDVTITTAAAAPLRWLAYRPQDASCSRVSLPHHDKMPGLNILGAACPASRLQNTGQGIVWKGRFLKMPYRSAAQQDMVCVFTHGPSLINKGVNARCISALIHAR